MHAMLGFKTNGTICVQVHGINEDEAHSNFWVLDKDGLITKSRYASPEPSSFFPQCFCYHQHHYLYSMLTLDAPLLFRGDAMDDIVQPFARKETETEGQSLLEVIKRVRPEWGNMLSCSSVQRAIKGKYQTLLGIRPFRSSPPSCWGFPVPAACSRKRWVLNT